MEKQRKKTARRRKKGRESSAAGARQDGGRRAESRVRQIGREKGTGREKQAFREREEGYAAGQTGRKQSSRRAGRLVRGKGSLPAVGRREAVKAALVFLAALAACAALYASDNGQEPETGSGGKTVLSRNEYGEGDLTQELTATINGETQTIEIHVSEQTGNAEETEELFSAAAETLEKAILGENESLDEVRSDLDLVTTVPDTEIAVTWETDDTGLVGTGGKLNTEDVSEDGETVTLTAAMEYEGEKAVQVYYARLYPPETAETEDLFAALEQALTEADEDTKEDAYMLLPDSLDGVSVQWGYVQNYRAFGVLLLGAVLSALIVLSGGEKKKEEDKKRREEMRRDYPQIVSRFGLYIGSGMTVRQAWFAIAESYERERARTGERAAYEEMVYAMHCIRGGMTERESYEAFGRRCALAQYRRFAALLAQNLRKGSSGLRPAFDREAAEAFAARKNLAKKLGDEAGTRMLIPLFMMLIVVFIMIIVPAYFQIQV